MAIGGCQYMTCRSMLGSSFRAAFRQGGRSVDREVLLCPEHERELRSVRDKMPGRLGMTPDGWAYSAIWMDALGFTAR